MAFALIDVAAQLDDGKGLEKTVADIKDANKRGALHFAAREGQTEVCKFLVEDLKLDVDTKDEDGMHLMFALSIRNCFMPFIPEKIIHYFLPPQNKQCGALYLFEVNEHQLLGKDMHYDN